MVPPVSAQIISEPEIRMPEVKTVPDTKEKVPEKTKTAPGDTPSTVKNTNSKTTVVKEKNPSKPATRKPKGKKDK